MGNVGSFAGLRRDQIAEFYSLVGHLQGASFPVRLHRVLYAADHFGFQSIICWQRHGRSFSVNNVRAFVEILLPLWSHQTKFSSFQRQLNVYGFKRITRGNDRGAYYHDSFLKGHEELVYQMKRCKRGSHTPVNRTNADEDGPNFYDFLAFPPLSSLTIPVPIPQQHNPPGGILGNIHGHQAASNSRLWPAYESMRNNSTDAITSTPQALQLLLAPMLQLPPDTRQPAHIAVASLARFNPSLNFARSQQPTFDVLQQPGVSFLPNALLQQMQGSFAYTSTFRPPVPNFNIQHASPVPVTNPALLELIDSLATILGSGSDVSTFPPPP